MLVGHNPKPSFTVKSGAALAPGLRVKWHTTAGQVVLAGNEACIGVTAGRATAAGQPIEILDIKSCGTLPFTAAGAIAAGAGFTSAANGKVASGAAGNEDYGVALTAATGDGAQFEGTSGL